MKRAMDGQGIAPFTMNRAEFSAFVTREIERWKIVVTAMKN
jgi:tripartite-type tricarboxylate transporter receptor subunit TctC